MRKPLLSEQSQAWLKAVSSNTRYFHYFAVCFEDDVYPMGKWNIPFFSIEEAFQFKEMLQKKFPNRTFMRVEGMLCADMALKNQDTSPYWKIWINKHKKRLAHLAKNNQGGEE
ncbi:hypothetical protein [Acinetobacter sp. ANC 5502]